MLIVQEIQTTGGNSALVPAKTFGDRNQAEAAYHTALATAAVSSITVHTVVLMDERGNVVKKEAYEHLPEAGVSTIVHVEAEA